MKLTLHEVSEALRHAREQVVLLERLEAKLRAEQPRPAKKRQSGYQLGRDLAIDYANRMMKRQPQGPNRPEHPKHDRDDQLPPARPRRKP